MDLKGLIEHYEKRATKWHNDIKYKKMCNINTSVMENSLQLLETIISDMRAAAKTSNENGSLPIPEVSGSGIDKLQWKCAHCNLITDEDKAITDNNGMDRCPNCNTVYGGNPKHYS